MARRSAGPRRLSNTGWLRYKMRRLHRFTSAILAGSESIVDQIELAYKAGFDGGWVKSQARPRAVAGRTQRHQDYLLLVQTMALMQEMHEQTRRGFAQQVVAHAMLQEPPPDNELESVLEYAEAFVAWSYDPKREPKPEWVK